MQTISFVCCVLFVLFTFAYLYFLQPNLIAQEQHYFSHGRTSYDGLLGACLVTLLLTLLGLILQRVLRLSHSYLSLAWMPSCYFLGVLTSFHFPCFPSDAHGVPIFMLVAMPLLFFLLLYLEKTLPKSSLKGSELRSLLTLNVKSLFLMFLCVGTLGNTSSRLHYELRASHLASHSQYMEALEVADNTKDVTPYLTAVRAYALSCRNQLGDRLFHYPMSNTSSSLLPDPNDTLRAYGVSRLIYSHLGYFPVFKNSFSPKHFLTHAVELDTLNASPVTDYLLCAHLLDADLPSFASLFFAKKDTTQQSKLETHYKEALLLYEKQTAEPDSFTCINDSVRLAYTDFIFTKDSLRNNLSVIENCKRRFGKTYWFYFHFMR